MKKIDSLRSTFYRASWLSLIKNEQKSTVDFLSKKVFDIYIYRKLFWDLT